MQYPTISWKKSVEYSESVILGEIIAGDLIKKACTRFLDDLENEEYFYFDEEKAQNALDFICSVKHSKGEYAGQFFIPEPWQVWIIANIFGFYNNDGSRRFNFVHIEVARKNGKSTLSAAIALLFFLGGESVGENYIVSSKKDQSRIIWEESRRMVQADEYLSKQVEVFSGSMYHPESQSKYMPLSSRDNTLDGLNSSFVGFDELHEVPQSLWDVMETSIGSRKNPLMIATTTAGFDRNSFCYKKRDYCIKILDGIIEDSSYFAAVYTLDEDDDWREQKNWIKANPNLGVSQKLKMVEKLSSQARELPSSLTGFLTKHMNIWTTAESRWLSPDKWKACAKEFSEAFLTGQECLAGLDLSSTSDLTALVLIFPMYENDELYHYIVPRFFLPEDTIFERVRKHNVPYDQWTNSGYIIATPGNVVDYDFIIKEVEILSSKFKISEIMFDPWNATQTATILGSKGHTCVSIPQTTRHLSEGMKAVEKWVISETLRHNANPVMDWMSSNICAKRDANDNLFPNKEKSTEKIDGMTALITAASRLVNRDIKKRSVYEQRGILLL